MHTSISGFLFFFFFFFCQAREYAETLENAVWTNQFDNTANRMAHYHTTGPEIWSQTGTSIERNNTLIPNVGVFSSSVLSVLLYQGLNEYDLHLLCNSRTLLGR